MHGFHKKTIEIKIKKWYNKLMIYIYGKNVLRICRETERSTHMDRDVMDRSEWEYLEDRTVSPLWRWTINILLVMLAIGLLFNIFVLINGFLHRRGFTNAFGVTPIVVVSDGEEEGLEDLVKSGDLLFAVSGDLKNYREGDTVAFTHGSVILIGNIASIEQRAGNALSFRVKAAYRDDPFQSEATPDNLIGDIDFRIPKLGFAVLFLATLPGRLIFVGIPLLFYLILLLIGAWYDGYLYRRARRTFLRPGTWQKVPLGEVAFWSYLSTALFTYAAIFYGTYDSCLTERHIKKRLAVAHAGAEPDPRELPVTHPVRMRHTRPIKPQRRKPRRAVSPVKPIAPISRDR